MSRSVLQRQGLQGLSIWPIVFTLVTILLIAGCEFEEADFAASPEVRMERMGERVYNMYCTTCHQSGGQGVPNAYPPLRGTEWVEGDKGRLIRLVLHGVRGPMEVQGNVYDQPMIAHGHLSDEQIAAVLTFIRQNFGNDASAVMLDEVSAVRAAEERDRMWEASELWEATGIPDE